MRRTALNILSVALGIAAAFVLAWGLTKLGVPRGWGGFAVTVLVVAAVLAWYHLFQARTTGAADAGPRVGSDRHKESSDVAG